MNHQPRKNKSVVAAMFGTALEYYDMSLYGLMAPLLISLFLPTIGKLDALILTFVMTPLNIIIRPMGAIVIGMIGDTYGRKKALLLSIGGITTVTGLIGVLPTYSHIGVYAPIAFILLRSLQGFFLAGEYNGGAIFALEHSNKNQHGYVSSLYSMYTVSGILCATSVATLVSYLPPEYWRIPYVIGFIGGFIGLYIRSIMTESPEFLKASQIKITINPAPQYRRLFAAIAMSALLGSLSIMPTVLMNSLLPIATSYTLSTIMAVNTFTTIFSMLLYPLFGRLSDRITIERSMILSVIAILLFSYPLINLLSYNSLYGIILMKIGFAVLMAWFIAPFHAWIQKLFQAKERYKGTSLCYSIGFQIGGLTAPLSLWAWKEAHSFVAIYTVLIIYSIIALIAMRSMHSKPHVH